MKLLRWALGGAASAGASYAIYRYSIGRKAKGEDVFVSPEKAEEALTQDDAEAQASLPTGDKGKRQRTRWSRNGGK